jgi:hypothetical protein
MSLTPGDLSTLLFSRTGQFHWAISIARGPTRVKMVQTRQPNQADSYSWIVEEQDLDVSQLTQNGLSCDINIGDYFRTNYPVGTKMLICALGKVTENDVRDIVKLLRSIPLCVVPDKDKGREARFTCRVWWREAIRRLERGGYINCPDVNALESECRSHGMQNEHWRYVGTKYPHATAMSSG